MPHFFSARARDVGNLQAHSRALATAAAAAVPKTKLLINGEFIDSQTTKWMDVHDPVRCCRRRRVSLAHQAEKRRPAAHFRCAGGGGIRATPCGQATNTVVTKVPHATPEEMREATKAAASAFKTWRNTTPLTRQRLMLDLQLAIRDHTEALAQSITKEQGKTLVDARGDVLRGLRTLRIPGARTRWAASASTR